MADSSKASGAVAPLDNINHNYLPGEGKKGDNKQLLVYSIIALFKLESVKTINKFPRLSIKSLLLVNVREKVVIVHHGK